MRVLSLIFRTSTRCLSLGLLGSAFGTLTLCMLVSESYSAEPRAPRKSGEPTIVDRHDFIPPKTPLTPAEVKTKVAELLAKYPLVSIADRLAKEEASTKAIKDALPPALTKETADFLYWSEVRAFPPNGRNDRLWALMMLHSENAESFVRRDGFGKSRLFPSPPIQSLELPEAEVVRYPKFVMESSSTESLNYLSIPDKEPLAFRPGSLPNRGKLVGFHRKSEWYFLDHQTLGYVRDRDHVAGFRPHQFSALPELITENRIRQVEEEAGSYETVSEWALRRLELVSLLKHAQPAVYLSATLPKMDELSDAQTRELTEFETESLKALRSGENLVARATANHIEMVGALRAAKHCLQCHQVQRGELLGAFTYELRRKLTDKPDEKSALSGE